MGSDAMIMLVGLGLEEGDISTKAMSALKSADAIYAERYTLPLQAGYISMIEKETGKKVEELYRKDMEEEVKATIEKARDSRTAILIPGDPLVATTHHLLLDMASEAGVETRVYHAPSIFSVAIGESGLDIYKFGPTTTIPFWSAKYKPTSFLDSISKNIENGEHTLVLLDVDPISKRTMSAGEAVDLLKKAAEKRNGNVTSGRSKILVICEAGCLDQEILYVDPSGPKFDRERRKLEGRRTALIIPAALTFAEEKLVSRFAL